MKHRCRPPGVFFPQLPAKTKNKFSFPFCVSLFSFHILPHIAVHGTYHTCVPILRPSPARTTFAKKEEKKEEKGSPLSFSVAGTGMDDCAGIAAGVKGGKERIGRERSHPNLPIFTANFQKHGLQFKTEQLVSLSTSLGS